jgi:long-chain acyl-CoA synthetase
MPSIVDFDTLPQLFDRLARRFAGQHRTALRYLDRKTKVWTDISWEQLLEQVQAMAGYLHKKGVRKGDRVAILAENRPEWAIVDMATQFLGAVNVSLYTSLPASQVAYILKDSGSSLFFVSTAIQLRKAEDVFEGCPDLREVITMSELRADRPEHVRAWDDVMAEGTAYRSAHAGELDALAPSVTENDLACLIYTSGTTGNPKGVMLTHRNLCSNARSALDFVPFGADDHHLSFLPLCHSFERTAGYTAILAAGAKITYAESIDAVSRNLGEVRPTVMISVPRLFEKMYNLIAKSIEEGSPLKKRIFEWSVSAGKQAAQARIERGRVGPLLKLRQSIGHKLVFSRLHEKLGNNLRFAVSGGAALPKTIGEFFLAAGVTIIEGYGLTETSPVLTANPIRAPRYGTVGHVIPGVTVGIQRIGTREIIGQLAGEDYPAHSSTEEGEIVARGPNIMKGYWNNPEATAEAIDAEGWYHTGDVGKFVDGYLVITDRIKHMIVSAGGKNIYPGPIEETFKTDPLIDQIMVIGEGREYLTALVLPAFDGLKHFARERGLAFADDTDLMAKEPIQQHFMELFKTYSKNAAAPEKIRDFRLIGTPFTVENGLMTPTLKLKRKAIEAQYKSTIEEMYGVFV